jgi:hypothetical protein
MVLASAVGDAVPAFLGLLRLRAATSTRRRPRGAANPRPAYQRGVSIPE